MLLKKGRKSFVPKSKHRLENPHHSFLEIIEVQMELLRRGCIIRYEDDYGRIKDPF